MDNTPLSSLVDATTWYFSDLRLVSGHPLSLQQSKLQKHFHVQYIGALDGHGLITTRPKGISDEWFNPSDFFVLRGLVNTHAFAIKCRPLALGVVPYPHIHFEYPKRVIAKKARSYQRFPIKLPVEATTLDDAGHLIMLTDISMTGAGVAADSPLGDKGDRVKVVIPIILEMKAHPMSLETVIAWRSDEDNGGYRYGLSFSNIADHDSLLLQAFIGHLACTQAAN